MINYTFYYSGPLIFKTKVSKEDLESIKSLCKKDKNKDYRKYLAGHLDHQYSIDAVKIQLILDKYLNAHEDAYKKFYLKTYPGKINCKDAWVNYMKSGETNPVHTHDNCDFSSVIFLDIPKGLKDENKKFTGNSMGPGSLGFDISPVSDYYIDSLNFVPEIGDFFIFPWNLKHFVSSFKSKGERISVACNFIFKKI